MCMLTSIYKHTMDICMYVCRLVIKNISKGKHTRHTRMHLHSCPLPAHLLLPHLCTAYLHAHAAALVAARCSPPSPSSLPWVILACACAMPQSCRAAYMNQLPSPLCLCRACVLPCRPVCCAWIKEEASACMAAHSPLLSLCP
jgi:hypothetical protein